MKKLLTLMLFTSCSVQAAIYPQKENLDHRITVVKYTPDDVIRVRVAIGTSTLIKFEKGETFNDSNSGLGIGDIDAWDSDVKGNHIFIKPKAEEPNTNLTLVSNKGRTYIFDLVESSHPHYVVKMQYEKVKNANDYTPKTPCSDGKINFNYMKWGHENLTPSYMWDDGRFTCLKFSSHAELPVAYQIGSDGKEALVNYSMNKDTMIIHTVSRQFRLRLGDQVLGLSSVDALSTGYNNKATSINAARGINNE